MKHIHAERMARNRRPIAVDLFAGAGGMSLGFEQAGFDIVAAVEQDPIHCAIHAFNFPKTAIIARPIQTVSGDDIRRAAGLGAGMIDVVLGGAPCQGFSMIGQRMLDDPRNRLVLDFVRIVAELQPRTFVFENVKGLTVGSHRRLLDELVMAFDSVSYAVRTPWRVLNAAHFGVPQHRERLILLGSRKGEPLAMYPEPVTSIAGRPQKMVAGPEGPTCRDALGDLPDADMFLSLDFADSVKCVTFGDPSRYAADLRCATNDAWRFAHVRDWEPTVLTSSATTRHTAISRRRFSETAQGGVEPISRFFRLPEDGVSNTLRAGTDGARGAFTSPRPIHYRHPRCVTVREMARLHGFPDWFRFHVTKWHGARQIGNAVPPPLARAVAASLIAALGVAPSRPFGAMRLGDEAMLAFDLTAAAAHFGVPPIPSRRDRQSGATKRKQVEIEELRQSLLAGLND